MNPLEEILNDAQFKAIYEDSYIFDLDGITFAIGCKIDSFGVMYFPDAISPGGQRVAGRLLAFRTTFNNLNFAHSPQWLVNAISPDYSMFTPAQKAHPRQGKPARPPELYIPL